jgi:glycosyltransferase involved in cell wall biosynthesis
MPISLSVVVGTRNRIDKLRRCVQALFAVQTSYKWELVIVDNGSTDGTADFLTSLTRARTPVSVKTAFQGKRGLGAAHNTGWRLATGEIIAFTDDDCYVTPDYIDAMISAFSNNKDLSFIGGRILLYDPTDYPITIQESLEYLKVDANTFVNAGDIQGANMAFRRDALEYIGGFDENLGPGTRFNCEGIDAQARAVWSGLSGAYHPGPTVYHHHGRKTEAEIRKLQIGYDQGKGAYFVKFILNPRSRPVYVRAWALSIMGKLARKIEVERGHAPPPQSRRRDLQRSAWEIFGGFKYLIWRQMILRKIRSRSSALLEYFRKEASGKESHFMQFFVRMALLRLKIRHVHGVKRVNSSPSDLTLICVVRNGADHVHSFMRHHLSKGILRFVFIDNGSTDRTVEFLKSYPGVTILQTSLPYSKYENTMKRYLAECFSRGRWNVICDIDERFDWPYSDRTDVHALLEYLNHYGYSAVVTQMLDMFSSEPLDPDENGQVRPSRHSLFDLSAIEKQPYPNAPSTIKMHWGGIRRLWFGTRNGLTKAALVKMDGRVKTFLNWHDTSGARIADITCLLLHFPFANKFHEKVVEAVQSGRYGVVVTDEYIRYSEGLSHSKPAIPLSAQELKSVEQLIAAEFLVVSEEFRAWSNHYHALGPAEYESAQTVRDGPRL